MEVIKMIPYEEADKLVDKYGETIGGLGGYFADGMRWKDYAEMFTESGKEYAEAFRKYILEKKLKHGGDWHQNSPEGAPLFSDGKAATFSYRAWGDIMAAIWSEKENVDYNYMSFYMDCTMQTKGSIMRKWSTKAVFAPHRLPKSFPCFRLLSHPYRKKAICGACFLVNHLLRRFAILTRHMYF